MLLNGHSKDYTYTQPIVFFNQSFEDQLKQK